MTTASIEHYPLSDGTCACRQSDCGLINPDAIDIGPVVRLPDNQPECVHGPMTFKTHNGQQGWVCTLPKGTPGRCSTIMLDGPKEHEKESSPPEAISGPKKARRDGPPKPSVPTRAPRDQNEHMAQIIGRLKGTTQHVAMVAHVLLGQELKRARFTTGHRELTREFLAEKSGLGSNAVRIHMSKAVKAGLFVRVDNSKGGPGSKNGSRYRAVVPDL